MIGIKFIASGSSVGVFPAISADTVISGAIVGMISSRISPEKFVEQTETVTKLT
jgi:hypothetical protein